jgi:hypothetical protein
MDSEEQKLNEWFNGERAKGLVDFKLTVDPDAIRSMTREELCADINAVNDAIAAGKTRRLSDKELDGYPE